jgi:hypothetical protein
MQKLSLLAVVSVLAGCASSGVVPMDRGSMMISKRTAAPGLGFSPVQGVKADVYIEANAYCSAQGKMVNTISLDIAPSVVFTPGSATLQFTCVAKSSAEVLPLQRTPDQVIEVRQR